MQVSLPVLMVLMFFMFQATGIGLKTCLWSLVCGQKCVSFGSGNRVGGGRCGRCGRGASCNGGCGGDGTGGSANTADVAEEGVRAVAAGALVAQRRDTASGGDENAVGDAVVNAMI